MREQQNQGEGLGIAAVEQRTGISQHVLRAWERRYGFPSPRRLANGERIYSSDEVARLMLIRRLIERGDRPARVVALPDAELRERADALALAPSGHARLDPSLYRDDLACASATSLRRRLTEALVREGLQTFILRTVRPLLRAIGQCCAAGEISIAKSQLLAEQIERVLQQAMAPFQTGITPVVLTATLAPERHRLGLLMLEALLRLEHCQCLPLGTDLTPSQLADFARQAGADILALSFSGQYDGRALPLLSQLRRELPSHVEIWCGGEGAKRGWEAITGLHVLPTLEQGVDALRIWCRKSAKFTGAQAQESQSHIQDCPPEQD